MVMGSEERPDLRMEEWSWRTRGREEGEEERDLRREGRDSEVVVAWCWRE